eukprot:1880109-Rhodomonas_salina.1
MGCFRAPRERPDLKKPNVVFGFWFSRRSHHQPPRQLQGLSAANLATTVTDDSSTKGSWTILHCLQPEPARDPLAEIV